LVIVSPLALVGGLCLAVAHPVMAPPRTHRSQSWRSSSRTWCFSPTWTWRWLCFLGEVVPRVPGFRLGGRKIGAGSAG